MFLDAVRSAIQKHRMLKKGDRVLVGVSGGPDSLALLTALVALRKELGIPLFAAYVDHGLRPAACRRETEMVRAIGRRWGVPVRILKTVVKKSAGESLEAVARKARYDRLLELAKKLRCRALALGHTQDDQAETVLMWLLRGAGTAGLAGIPPVRQAGGALKIIRPLIRCSRLEVSGFLKAHGIRPCQDASNRSNRFLRNRIRRELIPLLEREYNPQLRRHLAQTAEILREDVQWLEKEAEEEFGRGARSRRNEVRLDRTKLRAVPSALRRGILRLAVQRLQGDCQGFAGQHWAALEGLLLNGQAKGMDLPHRFRAEAPEPGWLLLRRKKL